MWSLMYAGAFDECLKLSRSILELQPANISVKMFEANSLLELGDYYAAIDAFTICLAINPDFFPALPLRGQAYYKQKEYKKALVDFEAAMEFTEAPMVYQMAATCHYHFKNKIKAYEYIDLAIKNDGDGNAYAQKAHFLEQDGRGEEALKYFKLAGERLPRDEYIKKKIKEIEKKIIVEDWR